MATTAIATRGSRGLYKKSRGMQRSSGANRSLPEYLEAHEVQALIENAQNTDAELLMVLQ